MSWFHKFRGFTLEWGWEEIVPSSGSEPSGNRGSAVFTRDGTSNNFCLIGGRTQAGSDLTDYWRFDLGTKQWTQVVASGLANVTIPMGYADGSGNIFVAGNRNNGQWTQFVASTQLSKINVSTGAQVALTDGGTGVTEIIGGIACEPSSAQLWFSGASGTYQPGVSLAKAVQSAGGNTNTKTTATSANTGRMQDSNPARYPAGNTLYMLAPSRVYTGPAWTLSANDIIKYDLTAGTGWVAETGVTNNAGPVLMPTWGGNNNQMVWCAAEAKFFIFVSNGSLSSPGGGGVARVLTYDPASKVLAEVLFSGQGSSYLLGDYDGTGMMRGVCGTVVNTGSDFYFCTAWSYSAITNARIWRFRRN